MNIKQHLPLEISRLTPSRIDTASDRSVSVSWMNTNHENPYGEAEEFAAFLVTAVNSHDALVEALRLALPWVSAPLDDRDMSASAVAHRAIRAVLETSAEEVANADPR